jgi:hypothetical protein
MEGNSTDPTIPDVFGFGSIVGTSKRKPIRSPPLCPQQLPHQGQ